MGTVLYISNLLASLFVFQKTGQSEMHVSLYTTPT